jgi:release factor glutamine methyltransferase
LALYSTGDGLDTIRAVERRAARLLHPGGVVGVEHADIQGEAVADVFTTAGRWQQVRDHPDLAGRPRFVTARLAR